jgi:V-type H+-transporting ATPase subunit d
MIDNVVLLISGTLHERDTHDLLERCHPLGTFETMPALCVATNVEELYSTVLVETPLGSSLLSHLFFLRELTFFLSSFPAPYFRDCLSAQDLDELNIEIIRNTVRPSLHLGSFITYLSSVTALQIVPRRLPLFRSLPRRPHIGRHVPHPLLRRRPSLSQHHH